MFSRFLTRLWLYHQLIPPACPSSDPNWLAYTCLCTTPISFYGLDSHSSHLGFMPLFISWLWPSLHIAVSFAVAQAFLVAMAGPFYPHLQARHTPTTATMYINSYAISVSNTVKFGDHISFNVGFLKFNNTSNSNLVSSLSSHTRKMKHIWL